MKVYLGSGANKSIGGIARVHEGLLKHLPCQIVKEIKDADLVNPHIGLWWDVPPGMPMVLSNHGLLWSEDAWGKNGPHTNKTGIEAILQADVITVPSEFVRKAVARATLKNSKVVHHGIDVDTWVPSDEVLGYVLWNKARVDATNDPTIVNVLATMLPDTPFVTTFGQPAENVNVIGKQDPEIMHKIVARAGVYLATVRESGGPCFGVLEAMACGVPVVSLNYGGTREVITHGETGWLANNPEELVEGINYCLEHRERIGANSRQLVVEKYQWKDTVLGYLEAYEEALHQPEVKASIIIPCYNLGQYVGSAIESALNQDFDSFEVIVINDASTDNSSDIIEKYRDRVKILHNKQNLHVSDSRNWGIESAKGKYILPLDADDTLEPDALRNMVTKIEQDRSLHMVAGRLNVTDGINVWVNAWPSAQPVADEQMKGHNQIPYSTLYRRSMWEEIGGYRRRIRTGIEDADFWMRAFSYGRKAVLLDQPTLNYTRRDGSLGRSHATKDEDWLMWYGWYYRPELRPTEWCYSNDPPLISVVIPVGPGHAHHVQACLDSLIAQTFPFWEALVINDTGKSMNVPGFPFVTFIDNHGTGVAAARNTGIQYARASRIVFLDADDIAQPDMLELLYSNHKEGWIYTDWYTDKVPGAAQDWNAENLWSKSVGPITGIYWKHDLLTVGGFDENAPGWEDWDLQLSLAEHGIGGTRLAYPVFTYNKHLGERRELNFANKDDLLQYIRNKHTKDRIMGCCGKGGGSSIRVAKPAVAPPKTFTEDEFVWVLYTGPEKNKQHLRSKVNPKIRYGFSATEPRVRVLRKELPRILGFPYFKVLEEEKPIEVQPVVPVLQVDTPVQVKTPLYMLNLDTKVINMLQTQFSSVEEVDMANDSDILTIKGIGESRLDEIREEIRLWKSG